MRVVSTSMITRVCLGTAIVATTTTTTTTNNRVVVDAFGITAPILATSGAGSAFLDRILADKRRNIDANRRLLDDAGSADPDTIVSSSTVDSDTAVSSSTTTSEKKKKKVKKLGLLTFDLDDTLYPVAPVMSEANEAFLHIMDRFGYGNAGLQARDIVETSQSIRSELLEKDPERAAKLTHTDIRRLAIRKEIEKIILERKLQAYADDPALGGGDVTSLAPVFTHSAKMWAEKAVNPSVVEAVLSAWEMERHHAAERHLYLDIIDSLKQIKADNPNLIIGAVTDGKANPLLMTFTLAPYFDFCMSWEDDQGSRGKFFQELASVEGIPELTWIYDAACEKYRELSSTRVTEGTTKDEVSQDDEDDDDDEPIWIHVGDDLAYDVGGSAACGAKTILCELAPKYGQTERFRAKEEDDEDTNTSGSSEEETMKTAWWSTSTEQEVAKHRVMNTAAEDNVDEKIAFLSLLPDAVNRILGKDV